MRNRISVRPSYRVKAAAFPLLVVMLLVFCVTKVIRGSDTSNVTNGGVWNYISLFYYLIALVAFIKRGYPLKAVMVFPALYVLLAVISTFINIHGSIDRNFAYSFAMVPYFLLVMYSFYSYSTQHRASEIIVITTFFICLGINLVTILMYQFGSSRRPLASDIYFSLCLFPFFLTFTKNKKLRNVVIVVLFAAMFFSGKRTGVISYALAVVVYFLLDNHINASNNMKKTLKRTAILLICAVILYYISHAIDNAYHLKLYYRLDRLYEDGGSGRNKIYSSVLQGFWNSDFFHKTIGNGLHASEQIAFSYAHNDFLEILYDFGVPALIFFLGFYIQLFLRLKQFVRQKSPYSAPFAVSLIIGLSLSMFSFFLIFYTYVTGIVAYWGYVLAMEQKRQSRKNELYNDA